ETGELEQPDGLGEPRVDHRRIPGRGSGEDPASLRRLGARRNPVRIYRGGRGWFPVGTDGQRGHPGGSPAGALEEITSCHVAASGLARVGGGHRGSPPCPEIRRKETPASSAVTLPHAPSEVKATLLDGHHFS